MAVQPQTASTGSTPNKSRKGGSRTVKDKVVFVLCEGTITNMHILFDAEAALDMKEQNPALTYRKVVIPARKKPATPPAPNGPTA